MIVSPSEKTLYEYLEEATQATPQKIMFIEQDHRYCIKDIYENVNSKASWLSSQGVTVGSIVAVRATKSVEAVCFFWAVLSLGAIAYVADEHIYSKDFFEMNELTEAVGFVTGEDGEWKLKTKTGETVRYQAGTGEFVCVKDAKLPAILIRTSGSSGQAKMVAHCQYGVINNLTDAYYFGDYREDDLALGILPFSHIFGMLLLVGSLAVGYAIAFPKSMQVDDILACVSRYGVTRVNSVPSLYLAMARKADGYDVSSLRVGFVGGAPNTWEEFKRIESGLGMKILPAYGMSECPSITIHNAKNPSSIRGYGVGQSYYYSTVRIKDEAGNVVGNGQEGEICVQSATLMLGYYQEGTFELETDEEGFFHTGDLGYFDEHERLFITGRIKEIIIRNGNNISLRKIEEAIDSVAGVEAVAVVGKKDDQCGEVPVAFVVSEVSEKVIFESIHKILAKNELPTCILYLEELPRTSSEKIDKQRLSSLL